MQAAVALTARATARQADLDCARVLSGSAVARTDDAEFQTAAGQATVFARIMPHERLRIVRALRATGDVIAMTGDGVNDAPSLPAAAPGIAMGGHLAIEWFII